MEHTEFIVFLEAIPPDGLERHLEIADAEAAGLELAVPLETPLTADFTLSRHGRRVLVRGRVRGVMGLECSRCLGRFSHPFAGEVDSYLQPGGEDDDGEDRELTREDLDVGSFAGGGIDLRDLIAEQVHLAVPVKPLCREDCRGLCPRCGIDLGKERCSCSPERQDPRWEALRKLKEK